MEKVIVNVAFTTTDCFRSQLSFHRLQAMRQAIMPAVVVRDRRGVLIMAKVYRTSREKAAELA